MILFSAFRRRFMTWKSSQFKQVMPLSGLKELPVGSILHILDNFQMDGTVSMSPRLNNPFTNMNKYRMYMTNIAFPEESSRDVAPVVTNKMIITSAGVMVKLNQYRMNMAPRVVWCDNIADLPVRPNTMAVVNYNPLFRARVLGMRRKPRFMNMLFAMLLNQIVRAPDRMHFIHIPLESLIFQRSDFIRVFKKYDRVATKYPEISSYLFLAHLYSIMMKRLDMPKRGAEFEETEEDIEEAKAAAEAFVIDPATWDPDITPKDFLTNINDFMMSDPEWATESLKIKDSENPYQVSIFEYLPPKYFEKVNFLLTCGTNYICVNMRDLYDLCMGGNAIVRIINNVNMLTLGGRPVETKETEEPEVTQPEEQEDDKPVTGYNDDVIVISEKVTDVPELNTGLANQPEYKEPMTEEDKLEAAKFDLIELNDIEKIVNKSVKTLPKPLTIAQREHVREIGRAYKTITLGNRTIQEILTDAPKIDLLEMPKFTTDVIDQGLVPKETLISTTKDLDTKYIQSGSMERDIASVLTSFNKLGMFLTDVKQEDQVDELNELVSYTAKYEDLEHKKHTIKFQLPKVDELGRAKINGTLKCMVKQRVANPICKVRPTRVTLNSNYNKLLVERNTNVAHNFMDWFSKALEKAKAAGWSYTLEHKPCRYPIVALPFELTEIGSKYSSMTFGKDGYMYFGIVKRGQHVPEKFRDVIQELENENGCWFGYQGTNYFFITNTGVVSVRSLDKQEEVFYGAFMDFFQWLTGVEMSPMVEYADLTVLSWKIPVIHALCYRYGLSDMLKYTGANYEIYNANERIERLVSDIVIRFSDKKLVIHRTPRNLALLFGGLCIYDFSKISIDDMDEKDVYYELLNQKRISTNLIKGLNALFDLFIDPITKDVLREMKEPTDLRDLLIRAVTMLTTSEHKEEASASNFRFRGVEQLVGIVYNEMARAYATYKNRGRGATNKFSLKEYQIKQRIAKEQLTENVAVINPLQDIKTYSKFSNAGSGGRSGDTFMISDRQFTKDQIGVVSEATTDNGKTGFNASLPANPLIVNGRGMVKDKPVEQLEPENCLSFISLLYPSATNDDSKRANMSHIQATHYVPTKDSDVSRLRSGYEGAVASRTRPPFAYVAEDDGIIEDINPEAEVIKVRYKNGRVITQSFGDEYTNNTGSYIDQKIVINGFKVGDKVKSGDVITYNKEYFQADPYSKQVNWKMGILAKVAIIDNGGTLEDASVISKSLADKMAFEPVHLREIEITTDTHVHSFAAIGTHVVSTDPLMVFDESAIDFGTDSDAELTELLSNLNKASPKAGFTGTIVKIEAFYKAPLSTMHESIQKIIKHAVAKKNARSAFAENTTNASAYQKSQPLYVTDKVGTIDLEPTTVILRFYIRHTKTMDPGDKLFFDNCLKSVVSSVQDEIVTEDGMQIDSLTSNRGILARLINSPFLQGITNNVLHTLEDDILKYWETGERPVKWDKSLG